MTLEIKVLHLAELLRCPHGLGAPHSLTLRGGEVL